MAKSRTRGIPYNPKKAERKAMGHIAKKSYLYRWQSYKESHEQGNQAIFGFSGTSSRELVEVSLTRAMETWSKWIGTVHSCFVSDDGYYEEEAAFETLEVRLAEDDEKYVEAYNETHLDQKMCTVDVEDIITQLIEQNRNSGNHKHYVDSVVVLRPYSEKFAAQLEDEKWCKKQFAYREKVIRETLK